MEVMTSLLRQVMSKSRFLAFFEGVGRDGIKNLHTFGCLINSQIFRNCSKCEKNLLLY